MGSRIFSYVIGTLIAGGISFTFGADGCPSSVTDKMAIAVPETAPTRSVDQLLATNPTLKEMTALAREQEVKYERLKLYHDNLLTVGFSPYLPATEDISDEDLAKLIHEAGWAFVQSGFTSEEWTMWTNRFRRLISAVRHIPR